MSRGAEACLPRNLPDEWLEMAAQSAEDILDEAAVPAAEPRGAIALAALLCILEAKKATGGSLEVSYEQLHEYVNMYRIELSLELVHRHSDIKYEPASLNLILTDREITTWRE